MSPVPAPPRYQYIHSCGLTEEYQGTPGDPLRVNCAEMGVDPWGNPCRVVARSAPAPRHCDVDCPDCQGSCPRHGYEQDAICGCETMISWWRELHGDGPRPPPGGTP